MGASELTAILFILAMVGCGLLGTVAFTAGIVWLFVKLFREVGSSPGSGTFPEDEEIVFEGPANHFKGIESVGGRLFLTEGRLRFVSHGFNLQRHDESYPLEEIVEVGPRRTMGMVDNGLRVALQDGREEAFVVGERERWLAELETRIGAGQ